MRVVSWNVNGLRAVMGKGFVEWLDASGADVVGLQEVRASAEQLEKERALLSERGWHLHVSGAQKKGYSGVGLLSRNKPDAIETTVGVDEFDVEGRVQRARFGSLVVVNGYFPNGNGKERDNSRIPYKLAFYQRVFELLESERRRGGKLLVMGDFNTAHKEIDLARPKTNQKTSGFTPPERAELDRWFQAGWIDTFREFEPGEGHYSWWSSRGDVRARDIGWRIDLVLASHGVRPHLKRAFIEKHVMGSDHCPIGVDLDDACL
ncbi:MAG: exodeoxyribonuclease III [Deltaproteobacteria bacterium]|nr:exodeoxyribonuclease III [Deltaproteobacteria bacterium]